MEKTKLLNILRMIEKYRTEINKNPSRKLSNNHVIRVCQSCIALEINDAKESLIFLNRLEQYRIKIQNPSEKATHIDHIIRMCQAHVAHGTFESRSEWTRLLEA